MEQTVKRVQDLGGSIATVAKRIDSLEKDSAFVTTELSDNDQRLQNDIQTSNEEIALIKENIDFIKTTLRNSRIELDILIKKLKETARKNELDRFQERVEQWNMEGLITKHELKETLKQ